MGRDEVMLFVFNILWVTGFLLLSDVPWPAINLSFHPAFLCVFCQPMLVLTALPMSVVLAKAKNVLGVEWCLQWKFNTTGRDCIVYLMC